MALTNDQSQESRLKLGSLSKGLCTLGVDDVTGGNQIRLNLDLLSLGIQKKTEN